MPFASIQALFEGKVSSFEELALLFHKEISAPHIGTPIKQGSSDIEMAERDINRLPLLVRIAKSFVADVESWTDEQVAEQIQQKYQDDLDLYEDAKSKAKRCLGIIVEAKAWNPTTLRYQRLKEVLVNELQSYVSDFDRLQPVSRQPATKYWVDNLNRALGIVLSYEGAIKHQKKRFREIDSECEDLSASIRTHSINAVKP